MKSLSILHIRPACLLDGQPEVGRLKSPTTGCQVSGGLVACTRRARVAARCGPSGGANLHTSVRPAAACKCHRRRASKVMAIISNSFAPPASQPSGDFSPATCTLLTSLPHHRQPWKHVHTPVGTSIGRRGKRHLQQQQSEEQPPQQEQPHALHGGSLAKKKLMHKIEGEFPSTSSGASPPSDGPSTQLR